MSVFTYVKAAAPLVPGASKLPWVAGGGGEMPDTELTREVTPDLEALAQYARVCGFTLRDTLPATYPHILAFPLHMQLMTSGSFPFPAVGLVHIENRIEVKRAIRSTDTLSLRVTPTEIRDHPKGKSFGIVTEASVDGEIAWREESTLLRRGAAKESGDGTAQRNVPDPVVAEWRLPGDLGRRYAGVSGDSNPIHMHPLSARLFGFPRAIAHGMWTKARCLAALESTLPEAYEVGVQFRKPILLPGKVEFRAQDDRFAVTSGEDRIHLLGTVSQ